MIEFKNLKTGWAIGWLRMFYTVFIDTNYVNNSKLNGRMFGRVEELEKLATVANVIIPEIVVQELKVHILKDFERAKESLNNNSLLGQIQFNWEAVVQFDFEAYWKELCERELADYALGVIKGKATAFERLCSLSSENLPPFESSSDKGFKDACIVCLIEEYLNDNPAQTVFLATFDRRLKSYCASNSRIVAIESYDDYLSKFSVTDEAVCPENLAVSIINGEAIPEGLTPEQAEIIELLDSLRHSSSFAGTHKIIRELNRKRELLAKSDYLDILISASQNSQIYWIFNDDDISTFLMPIFLEYGKDLPTEIQYTFMVNNGLVELPPFLSPRVVNGRHAWIEKKIESIYQREAEDTD